jgi:hypothetical protein
MPLAAAVRFVSQLIELYCVRLSSHVSFAPLDGLVDDLVNDLD